jgi:hypothetical protein
MINYVITFWYPFCEHGEPPPYAQYGGIDGREKRGITTGTYSGYAGWLWVRKGHGRAAEYIMIVGKREEKQGEADWYEV